jgi:NADPH:quinone reductase-like Zn-dependent oxidoreductase
MRALTPTGIGDKMVEISDVPEAEPQPHELVMRVDAFSVNRGETFLLANPKPGWRPGKDIAGTVVRAAADGTGPAVGTRVVGHPWYSGWAERAAVPVESVAVLPNGVDTRTAAALPLAGISALRLLRRAGASYGDRALITGASGGIGHYFVELATAAGIEVTAVSATQERGRRLRELGAVDVVSRVEDARGIFDVVLESVGDESLPAALAKVRPGGRLIWFGQASRTAPSIDFFSFFAGPKEATIEHFDYTRSPRTYGEELAVLVRLVDTGRLHPEIGLLDDWSQAVPAIRALRGREVRGNIVLTIGPAAPSPQ